MSPVRGRISRTAKRTEGQHAKDSFGNIGCLHFGIVFDGKRYGGNS
jgi:hypothetical protein